MEPTMISLKVLSAAAAMTLVLPMVLPSASFAQQQHTGRTAGAPGGGGPRVGGGGGPRFNGGGAPRFNGGGGPGPRFSGNGGGGGGGYRGGGGFVPGLVAGAVIGGAIAGPGYGYGPGYYGPGYSDDQYYDDGPVAVVPGPVGDDGTAYCMQTYRSYDPRSGTYMGNDGFRHPCP
jgi:hypothetical protein